MSVLARAYCAHRHPAIRAHRRTLLVYIIVPIQSTYALRFVALRCSDWLLMDGPLDPTWMETLNSAMDDSRCLRLPTGESVPRGRNTRLIFETADLSHISPSTVRTYTQ